jgi:hypothetical protein
MQTDLLQELAAQRHSIRQRWEQYLRIEPVASPLGHPDTLVFGIRGALREIFALLRDPPAAPADPLTPCPCGKDPLHAFFVAGEQALLESLVLLQAHRPAIDAARCRTDIEELRHAVRHVAHREMSALARLCQASPSSPNRSVTAPA